MVICPECGEKMEEEIVSKNKVLEDQTTIPSGTSPCVSGSNSINTISASSSGAMLSSSGVNANSYGKLYTCINKACQCTIIQ